MKKIAMFVAAAAVAVSASAQKKTTTITAHEAMDNIYVGVNAGASTNLTGANSFSRFQPNFGVRVGKNFTTVFGLAIDGNAYFNTESCASTVVSNFDVNLLGTANLMNAFGTYKGTPRFFEISAIGGLGWTHFCSGNYDYYNSNVANGINAKAGLDFTFNLGEKKAWQIYIEPIFTWNLATWEKTAVPYALGMEFNANNSNFALKVGFNYKFKTSNGTHNFAIEQLRDQAEIDALNSQINGLRGENDGLKSQNAAKDAKIKELQKALSDCENKPAPVVETKAANLQPSVVFAQGKTNVEKSQYANIEMIAKYMKSNPNSKVKISGYASPEGSKEINQKISENRAKAVKDVLVKKYKISADRLETEGLGATDKLFDQVEFNRVALFNDTTK